MNQQLDLGACLGVERQRTLLRMVLRRGFSEGVLRKENAQNKKVILEEQTIRGEQRAPENATHPKTQKIDRSENLRFRVCCVFWCSLFASKRAPKHTRKRNTPEMADLGNGELVVFSGVLRFRVCSVGIIERGTPQTYVHARASSATLCSVHASVLSVSKKGNMTRIKRAWIHISDTYPNPYPPVTAPLIQEVSKYGLVYGSKR